MQQFVQPQEFPIFLSDADKTNFQRDGAIVLKQVIPTAWIDFLRSASIVAVNKPGPYAEQYVDQSGGNVSNSSASNNCSFFFTDLELAQRLKEFRNFSLTGPCGSIAGQLMGSREVCFLYDQYFEQRFQFRHNSHTSVDNPVTDSRNSPTDSCSPASTPFHQDQPYWSVKGDDVVTVWLPLDPIPTELSVQFVSGSHKWGREYIPRHFATGVEYEGVNDDSKSQFSSLPSVEDIKGHKILSWSTEPGDVIVFYGKTIHGQDAEMLNNLQLGGEDERTFRRLALRFTGDDARYTVRNGEAKDVIPSVYHPCGLKEGDRMRCERFPRVWVAADAV